MKLYNNGIYFFEYFFFLNLHGNKCIKKNTNRFLLLVFFFFFFFFFFFLLKDYRIIEIKESTIHTKTRLRFYRFKL